MMLTAKTPFPGKDDKSVKINIVKNPINVTKYFENKSEECKDFIKKACDQNLKNRASAITLLKHPWIKKMSIINQNKLETDDKIEIMLNL